MAFMMPVMKNEFDIYKGRQRRISECSNQSNCRSRKVSESSRSDCPSLSTSPGTEGFMSSSPAHRSHPMYMSHLASRSQFSRNSSRTSQSSLIASSPSKASAGSSPPKGAAGPAVPAAAAAAGSQSSLNKFHSRLVDKLRKSLRKSKSTDGRPDAVPNHEDGGGGDDDDDDGSNNNNNEDDDETPGEASHHGSRMSRRLEDEVREACSDSVLHVHHRKPPLPRTSTSSVRAPGKIRSRRGTYSAPR
ncbi:AGAP013079-PA [Anopheles gambiae str. PEST]|uniref:AGAP013079-PA n=2 Tax=gambiae species complex TaxID=44542 RepID=F5HM84_ANOGA|nr:AGAP013079-PA [Anopheles gambiae str. PEST]